MFKLLRLQDLTFLFFLIKSLIIQRKVNPLIPHINRVNHSVQPQLRTSLVHACECVFLYRLRVCGVY